MDIAHWDIVRLLTLDLVLHLFIVDVGKYVEGLVLHCTYVRLEDKLLY